MNSFAGGEATARTTDEPGSSSHTNDWKFDPLGSAVLARVSDAVLGICPAGNIRYLNRAAQVMLGEAARFAIGKPVSNVLTSSAATTARPPLEQLIAAGHGSGLCTIESTSKTRPLRDVNVTVTPVCEVKEQGFVIVISDTTELRRANKRLNYEARHDSLTSLYNRRELVARIERLLARRTEINPQHTLLYIDLDRFKLVNDSHGHTAGDDLLRTVGSILKEQVRDQDTVARIGGDEFVVLLEQCTLSMGRQVAESILGAIGDQRFSFSSRDLKIGASIGVVPIDRNFSSCDEVIAAADTTCYQAKRQGRNCAIVYRRESPKSWNSSLELMDEFCVEQALNQDLFELYEQQIFRSDECGRPVGTEILLRGRNPSGQLVEPELFLDTARGQELTTDIDRWVISHTLDHYTENSDALARLEFVSVNLSAASLLNEGFVEHLEICLNRAGISSSKFCFEFTDDFSIESLSTIKQRMQRLSDSGCIFAIDDFGASGHRFDHIRDLPVHIVKIDGALATAMCGDLFERTVVKSTNEIAHLLNKRTVLKHVENEVILEEARQLGIDYCQGRHFGPEKPLGN